MKYITTRLDCKYNYKSESGVPLLHNLLQEQSNAKEVNLGLENLNEALKG